ncbi:hypothetical protein Heshes_23110 [Alicyclobacillus hesperidum]|uniref:DUF177 domain-containing protein n=1 Tax=Alicyclobacillus hesperidum TaxID=89784 RepID=A0AA37TZH7_9BACL|nr:DUF177 domain-containing protein [Alicyclobacillus hesperidum]GLV14627.1 hypothetical protein Heshes_23110 [Alicyclobacillus hesperidum]
MARREGDTVTMKIDVQELKREGQIDVAEVVSLPRVAELVVDIEAVDDVHVSVHATYRQPLIEVDGCLRTVVHYRCSRCLGSFARPLEAPLHETYTLSADSVDDEIRQVADDEIELTPELEQAMFLAIDERPLCSETCRGLCPVCGCNRNERDCSCDTHTIDPRLEALKGLLSDGPSE